MEGPAAFPNGPPGEGAKADDFSEASNRRVAGGRFEDGEHENRGRRVSGEHEDDRATLPL